VLFDTWQRGEAGRHALTGNGEPFFEIWPR
jgi:hypothetical protein